MVSLSEELEADGFEHPAEYQIYTFLESLEVLSDAFRVCAGKWRSLITNLPWLVVP